LRPEYILTCYWNEKEVRIWVRELHLPCMPNPQLCSQNLVWQRSTLPCCCSRTSTCESLSWFRRQKCFNYTWFLKNSCRSIPTPRIIHIGELIQFGKIEISLLVSLLSAERTRLKVDAKVIEWYQPTGSFRYRNLKLVNEVSVPLLYNLTKLVHTKIIRHESNLQVSVVEIIALSQTHKFISYKNWIVWTEWSLTLSSWNLMNQVKMEGR